MGFNGYTTPYSSMLVNSQLLSVYHYIIFKLIFFSNQKWPPFIQLFCLYLYFKEVINLELPCLLLQSR